MGEFFGWEKMDDRAWKDEYCPVRDKKAYFAAWIRGLRSW
jgi:hypothetical protein